MAIAMADTGEEMADTMHGDHRFEPGVSTDHAPGESDPRWCNACGEAATFAEVEVCGWDMGEGDNCLLLFGHDGQHS